MKKLLVSALFLLSAVMTHAQETNAVQTGFENSFRTGEEMVQVSYPVSVVDNGARIEVNGFAGYGKIVVKVNRDLSVTIDCGQQLYAFADMSADELGVYGNACLYSAEVDGYSVRPNTSAAVLKGKLEGNAITIDNADSEGCFWICTKADGDGLFYSLGLFQNHVIMLNEGVFKANDPSGIEAVADDNGPAKCRIYTPDGRFAGTDRSRLAPGMYIMNGKKLIKH